MLISSISLFLPLNLPKVIELSTARLDRVFLEILNVYSVDNHHMVLCLALSLVKLLCYAYLVGVSPTRNHLYYHDQ